MSPAIKHTLRGSLPSSPAPGSTLWPGSSAFWGTNPSYAESTIHTALINIPVGMLLTLLTVANRRVIVSEIIPIKLMTQTGILLFIKSWFS